MEPGDLFEWAEQARFRRSDPDTSRKAADSLSEETLSRLQGEVYRLVRASRDGLTSTEVADALNMPRDSISPRIKPMVEAGLVLDSGRRRVPPGKTRQSIVWVTIPHLTLL